MEFQPRTKRDERQERKLTVVAMHVVVAVADALRIQSAGLLVLVVAVDGHVGHVGHRDASPNQAQEYPPQQPIGKVGNPVSCALARELGQGPVLEVFEIDPSLEEVAGPVLFQGIFAVAESGEFGQMPSTYSLGNRDYKSANGG